ncbi:MAG: tRNA pseudouridine synthase A [Phycisphaerales bacterium]
MPRYKLTIAYDGTHFCGWQKQEPFVDALRLPKAQRDVAGEVSPLSDAQTPTTKASRDEFVVGDGRASGVPAPMRKSHREERFEEPDAPALIVEQLETREGEDRPRVAMRTVQHVVEQAVRAIVRERVVLDGASRTDSGVHAKGQVAAFTCSGGEANERTSERANEGEGGAGEVEASAHVGWPISRGTERLVRAINARLPADVLVTNAEVVGDTFNPITDCTSKAYSYTLHTGPIRPLFDRNLVHCVYDALDVAAMQAAAKYLVGEHDFVSFAALHHGRATTVRTVFSCDVTQQPCENKEGNRARGIEASSRVRIDISGNGFLYNMVRIIAGTLVEVGRGRMKPEVIPEILAKKDRRAAGPTLPGRGLCLEWIRYEGEKP